MHKQLSVVLIFWKLSISIATENIYLIITQSVISRVWRCAVLVMISWSVFYLQTPAENICHHVFILHPYEEHNPTEDFWISVIKQNLCIVPVDITKYTVVFTPALTVSTKKGAKVFLADET